jgi:hypothetical protein
VFKRFVGVCIAINLINFLRAQETFHSLYAEDARVFLPERIELGVVNSLFEQHSGYLNLYPRIVFALAAFVSLENTPLFVAIVVNCSTALLVTLVYLNWRSVFKSKRLLLLSSCGVALTPILGLSSLGNASYFHFQLLASSILLIASPDLKMHRKTKFIIYCLTILSDPLFFLLPMMMVVRSYKDSLFINSTRIHQTILLIACAAQGLNIGITSKANRPLSTSDFNLIESFYLFFDRVVGSTLIPFFGFIDNNSRDDLQKLAMRLLASVLVLGIVFYVAMNKSKLSSDRNLYSGFVISAMYFFVGALTIAPEARYAVVPGIVLWFTFGYVFDSFFTEKLILQASVQTWIVVIVSSTFSPSSVFLEKVDWQQQIKNAREYCVSNKLQSIEITGRPVKVPSGEEQHSFTLSCENLKEN